MNKQAELKAKIDQNKADQQKLKEIGEKLEQELRGSEVTYSVGDRFIKGVNKKHMLIRTTASDVFMVNLELGDTTMSRPVSVKDIRRITQDELNDINSCYTRYWDARKKEKR